MLIYELDEFPAELAAKAAANKLAYAEKLLSVFAAAVESDVIMSSQERIDRLLDACKNPISDDASYNHFYLNAQKDLVVEAAQEGFNNQAIPVMPTSEQIHALTRKRYDEKAAKELVREEAKAAKAAKAEKEKKP